MSDMRCLTCGLAIMANSTCKAVCAREGCDCPCNIPSLEEANTILREHGLDQEEVGKHFAEKARELMAMMSTARSGEEK